MFCVLFEEKALQEMAPLLSHTVRSYKEQKCVPFLFHKVHVLKIALLNFPLYFFLTKI